MYSGNHFLDNQVRERIFAQIVAIRFYRLNSLMLAGVIPETPLVDELSPLFTESCYEVHEILLPAACGKARNIRHPASTAKYCMFSVMDTESLLQVAVFQVTFAEQGGSRRRGRRRRFRPGSADERL
jgi:hypothetical protein